jgi:hypothetical protein
MNIPSPKRTNVSQDGEAGGVALVTASENRERFLQEVFPAIVGAKRLDGTVLMNSTWFEFRDGYVWLNSWRGSHWRQHLERDGEVALEVLDPRQRRPFCAGAGAAGRSDDRGSR